MTAIISGPHWRDPEQTDGKIIQNPEPDSANPKATTLYSRCPLGPVFNTSNIDLEDLPAVNLSHDFFDSYAFSTFSTTVLIINGDSEATNIGCISTNITPDMGGYAQLLRFLPLLILLLTGFAVIFAAIWSPWGSTDVFHWTSNYGRDADLLRLVTPGFGDCLQYIQFIVLTGGLSLNYPGFYQPIVSQASWSSLIFNQSFVTNSEPWQSVVDGIYVKNGTYGLEEIGQLVGIARPEDVWAGMMVWLLVIIAAVSVFAQIGFLFQWVLRTLSGTPEEDLRSKNVPFSVGNVIRIVYNYFLLPIISISAFQLVIADRSPAYTIGLAVVTIVFLIVPAAWTLRLIIKTRPKSVLFDDLPNVLRYGPLYNTYSDHSAAFALIPVLLTFIRGIAIGAVQDSGIAQVILLAICEVIQVLTIHAFRPFNPPTSMNAYHTVFSTMRFFTVMLMVAFAPNLGVTDGPKGWIGYVILLLHAVVLVLGFFINALQTIVEVVALMLGAGGDDDRGLTRGGLSKIFGMRQLARRGTPRNGPSRASQLSTSAMLDVEDGTKTGYSMPSGRVRSSSGASLGGMLGPPRHRDSSVMDSVDMYPAGHGRTHRHVDSGSSVALDTPGGTTSIFSFLTSPTAARSQNPGLHIEAADPYYRPPRRRQGTLSTELENPTAASDAAAGDTARTMAPPGASGEDAESAAAAGAGGGAGTGLGIGADISRNPTPAPGAANPANALPNRPDYSTREVDFYYGVRGPALNSDGPGRKLGTGPADPTGPVATATGWFRGLLGGKTKEKGKGFEVVRSARMRPDMMARNGAFGDETPPEGIPVAMGVLRNGPIDSDDDEPRPKASPQRSPMRKPGDLLTETGEPRGPDDDEPDSPVMERLPRGSIPPEPRAETEGRSDSPGPEIPRKSSKRNSALVDSSRSATTAASRPRFPERPTQLQGPPLLARLPFERTASQRRLSSHASSDFNVDLSRHPSSRRTGERPASFGMVSQHNINRVDPEFKDADLIGTSAEVVNERSSSRQT
ncbi:putative membrane protein -like protein [Emericellopsis cladophorae]|uniref:Membrane protein -like protein n=1 Tax=Emericellopsis cladophorae TaxID=2686198 RepID=A0A9Q0BHX7_9HYPO|nr:putative membrane protein -like protein [Emericellopsis cladophorae]KAI6785992.1 putative membrane protein -like protein [Emericellopsis cladophorae]